MSVYEIPIATLDGMRAHQWHLVASDREQRMPAELRKRRDELELAVAGLRSEKERLGDDAYYDRLEKLLVELAKLYQTADKAKAPAPVQ